MNSETRGRRLAWILAITCLAIVSGCVFEKTIDPAGSDNLTKPLTRAKSKESMMNLKEHAMETGRISLCRRLEGESKAECVTSIVVQTRNAGYCSMLKDSAQAYADCRAYAVNATDGGVCAQFEGNAREKCLEGTVPHGGKIQECVALNGTARSDCVTQVAVRVGNVRLCDRLGDIPQEYAICRKEVLKKRAFKGS